MKWADLHLHTLYSDSTYTVQELINKVAAVGISCIAVTDHDTVEGLIPVLQVAKQKDIEVIPGIELTAEYNGLEVHILGYFINQDRSQLLQGLRLLRQNRIERMHKMLQKLREMNIEIEPLEVFALAGPAPVGRLHLARVMLRKGYVDSIYQAFQRYIGERSRAYVCGFRLNPAQAVRLIKESGGIAVLAHPYTLKREELIPLFVEYGIEGLEVYYPEHNLELRRRYKALAHKYNLLLSGGSDCHGTGKPGIRIGDIKIPYSLVEEIKARLGLSPTYVWGV
jgi:hypothetical protein